MGRQYSINKVQGGSVERLQIKPAIEDHFLVLSWSGNKRVDRLPSLTAALNQSAWTVQRPAPHSFGPSFLAKNSLDRR